MQEDGPRSPSMPDFLSALSFLKHVAAKKVHPAACYRAKGDPRVPGEKRRSRDADADDYLPRGKRQAPGGRRKPMIVVANPVADAVAYFVTQRGKHLSWKGTSTEVYAASSAQA